MSVTFGFPSGMAGMRRDVDLAATCAGWGVPEKVIQRILRHANVTTTYYIKTAADDVRKAMTEEKQIADSGPTPQDTVGAPVRTFSLDRSTAQRLQ
jgi:hypothetical protein